ncbi:MAG: lipopolysaccharide assembly protein LapA domain-containing protein [Dongiaceae bacterium]
MKRFSWIVTLPIAVVAVLFAVMNRAPVTIDLWPLPWRIEAPAFLILLGSLVVGLLIGLLLSWLTGGNRRRRARQLAHENERLAAELRELRRQAAERSRVVSPPASGLPVAVRPASVPTANVSTGLPPAQGPGQV